MFDAKYANGCGVECVCMVEGEGFYWSAMYDGDDGWFGIVLVGTYDAGRMSEGLKDMVGNVWEWTSTSYVCYDGSRSSTKRMVMRGGCWDSYMAKSFCVINRVSEDRIARCNVDGFRCAK